MHELWTDVVYLDLSGPRAFEETTTIMTSDFIYRHQRLSVPCLRIVIYGLVAWSKSQA